VKIDKDGTHTIKPGTYCKGIIISGSKTRVIMEPGTYVMRGGGFNVESGATVEGSGVTIYNSCNHANGCAGSKADEKGIKIASGSTVKLTAPDSGPMKGMIMFQDRDMSKSVKNEISSNTSTVLDGVLYFPTQHLRIHSGTGTQGDLKIVVLGGQLEVSSGSTLGVNALPTNVPTGLSGNKPRLVQ
jgi:hypothetical protein